MPEVLETKKCKAKKDHVCDYCGFKILTGEIYTNQTAVYEGTLFHWKSHISCDELASSLNMFDYADEGVTEDYFHECVEQFLIDNDIEAANWKEKVFKAKELALKGNTP